jgi:hypothetical protein
MRTSIAIVALVGFLCTLGNDALLARQSSTANSYAPSTSRMTARVPIRITVSVVVSDGRSMPELTQNDIKVKCGKMVPKVASWVPATGNYAGLELFFLIDDAVAPQVDAEIDELKAFISALPPSTLVGLAYARDGTVDIVQAPTSDHSRIANSLRLPAPGAGAYGSPYLSAVKLTRSWPQNANRRSVVLVSDGIDHTGRDSKVPSARVSDAATTIPDSLDVDTAISAAQRTGTVINVIYMPASAPGTWIASEGQSNLARLSSKTGGDSYLLASGFTSMTDTLGRYLNQLHRYLDNQFLLTFEIAPDRRGRDQSIKLSTDVLGVKLVSADSIWVPGAK